MVFLAVVAFRSLTLCWPVALTNEPESLDFRFSKIPDPVNDNSISISSEFAPSRETESFLTRKTGLVHFRSTGSFPLVLISGANGSPSMNSTYPSLLSRYLTNEFSSKRRKLAECRVPLIYCTSIYPSNTYHFNT